MRYCNAVRIDHVVGLQHLYWVPAGHNPDQGAYDTYPFDDLVGILALENWRNHCVVVGEDLGTVPAGFSEKLNEHGILSYRVLYFEQDSKSGPFIPPDEYRSLTFATVGIHDLATLRGWWLGNDIAIREQHRLYRDPLEGDRQRKIRHYEKQQLLTALRLQDLDPGDGEDFWRLSRSVHAFLARSGASISMVQLEDLNERGSADKSARHIQGTSELAQATLGIFGRFRRGSKHSKCDRRHSASTPAFLMLGRANLRKDIAAPPACLFDGGKISNCGVIGLATAGKV